MDRSTQIQGSHSTSSPSGKYIASISSGKLRICNTTAPERSTEVAIRIPLKDVSTLRWSDNDHRIAILSAQNVEVIDLDDASHRIKLDNGSGGLGRFISAEFIRSDQLLAIWEFGKAKLWDLSNGKGVELSDVKTVTSGDRWRVRPGSGHRSSRTVATLSRSGADDLLNIYLPSIPKHITSAKLPTADAQSISWSPDGRWIALLDTPIATPSIHFYTPDGHHYRSYPPSNETSSISLGIKNVVWSGNSQFLALTRHDGRIALLNTRTFIPLAVIEHTTTIDQRALPSDQHAPIWQEVVSASGERSYTASTQAVSPPLSRSKTSTEPSELGVAEARFSSDGSYLATRDERMLNTVWIWSMSTFTPHAVLIQHSNVRKMHWHSTRSGLLILDCGEGIGYLFNAPSTNSPTPLSTSIQGAPALSWIPTQVSNKSALLASTKASFRVLYPEGQSNESENDEDQDHSQTAEHENFDEGVSEDSLFDVLSGRTPLPPKTEASYTEMVDLEVETEDEDYTTRVDDTFREKQSRRPGTVDPFDDSQIF